MLFVPYSTALQLRRFPVVTYATAVLCIFIFLMQISSGITEILLYYPESWNPFTMLTSAVAHGGWFHLIGNLIFYLAFAPALEVLLDNTVRYIWIMVFISFVVGISYSVSTLIGASEPLPALGFSGVVMGMIGLSAYLMPRARIRVFWWFGFGWKTLYVQAWALAVIYIGLDTWTMLTAEDYGYVNVVAHVSGGFAGYLYGYLRLSDRRQEVDAELAHEIRAMDIRRTHGKVRSEAFRYNSEMDQRRARKSEIQGAEKFMSQLYQMVRTHRDGEAVNALLEKYDLDTHAPQLEQLFERVAEWGGSRTLLCLGRMIIQILDQEQRHGRSIVYIEKCQQISPKFALPDLSKVLFYAEMAIDAGKLDVARNLLADAPGRYGRLVDAELCDYLLQRVG